MAPAICQRHPPADKTGRVNLACEDRAGRRFLDVSRYGNSIRGLKNERILRQGDETHWASQIDSGILDIQMVKTIFTS